MWDLWNGGNETLCTSKGTTYGLNCSWSDSFCVQSQTGCDAFNGDKEGCFETMFCWWDKNTQTCNSPGDVGGGGWVTEAEGDKIDPGCWIFDYEQQYCNESYADVCRWNNATQKCAGMSSNAKITCGNIKNSELCENIPVLKTCCEWKNNKCQSNPESISCYANIEAPPQGAAFCEDYASYTSNETCANIAGSPWFMPCKWDGSNCVFRSEDMFGGEKKGCDSIAGKKECEFAGCEWTIEQYCNGTQAIPFGYCKEKTGIGSKSCNAACWACEWKDSTGNWVNSTNITFARTACQGSTLGYCNFTADSSAPNGIGFCNIPKDIQYIGDCNKDCKSCESKPNPQSSCGSSNANCKWVNDTTGVTTIGGWCYPKSEKSCSEDCFKCYDQISCVDYGGGSKGTCVWETETKICKPKNFDNEICFDGIDNDGDSRVDCDDADCFSDSFCGATTTSSCWQYSTESNCNIQGNNSNCIWIKNPWEGKEWCGLRGENCFLWDGDQTGCGNQSVCQWFPDPKGGFCDVDNTKVQTCFKATTQGACNINSDCYWQIDSTSSTGGTCKPKIFLCWDKTTQTNCTTGEWSSRCKWIIDNATGTGSCKPICFSNDLKTQTACDNNANCNWMGGFCDPAQQFGMKTEDCWKYDDNSTACNQVASCQFHTEASGGMCDINFTMNQETCTYITNQTGCMAAGGGICKWNQNEGNTFCDLKIFGCGFYQNNTTCLSDSQNYTNGVGCAWESGGWCECTQPPCDVSCGGIVDETSCNAFSSSGCGWRGPHCNPICFNQTNGLACGSKAPTCIWKQGFCEPKMVKTMFGGMEEKPIDLGGDECGVGSVDESLDDEVDICGFGMKEMPDNYGFGTGVLSLENAALCKGKKIVKQGPTGLQTITDSGTGLNTTRLYLYLDTDGSRTGNCWLWNDPDQDGYEFFFNYVAEIIDGEVKETKTSYRCKDSNWVVADIKLSGFRTLMCSEIGSMMISVNRDDLKKFTTLFMSGEEMRVYMATASKKRTESLPSDTVGPGYYTPGSNDFRPEDCLTSGVDMDSDGFNSENDPDCFMFYQMGGFMKYEDCFETGRDEDLDGLIDCNDPDCRIAPNCGGKGVNAANYNDTSIPTLTWSDVKKFPDSAFIKYDSSEPANGTVFFYYNSSSCPNTNTSGKDRIIKDVTLLDNDTNNNYNNWHDTSIDNFDFNSQKLGYALESNTTYYYKIKLCDPSGNCGLSSCLNFTTAASSSRTNCPDCTFSFKLEGATDFKIDLGGTGTYTSLASEVGACEGTGLRVNYSQASKANVRAEGDDSAVVFENASLIGVSGILNITEGTTTSGGYSVGYAGIPSDVFDDIGGKMRPKICKIEIPKGTSGNCDKVWKCDDNVENCIDMTNNATLLNNTATLCIWQIPCDFSTYRTNSPTSTAETTGGGGGGGGGGGASGTTVLRAKGNVNITVSAISAGKTSNIAIYKTEDVAFRELNITVWKDVSKVKLVIMKLSTLPTAKDVDGKIYHYISIDKTNITDSDISKTYIKFAVEKSWINSNKIDPLTIHLYRWETDRWNSLTTSKVAENSEEIFYRAEFSGLSYFAIAGYKVGEAPTGAAIACIENWSCTEWSACVANQQTRTCTDANNCGTTADKPAESRECLLTAEFAWGFAPLTYIVIVAVIIIIAIGIVIWRQKHKR
jgi:PGF-pre-PGF domain-containing protein